MKQHLNKEELESTESTLSDSLKNMTLREIVEKMPGYIYWKNTNSEYMGCNNNFAKISNLSSPKEVVGKKDVDFSWGK